MPHRLCHFEFMTQDPEQCKAFYGSVFGWQFDDESMPGYTLVNTGGEPSGAIFKKPDESLRACANMYFQTHDLDGMLNSVLENGGKVLVEKTAIEGVGHFAMFSDPEGVVVGLMQPAG